MINIIPYASVGELRFGDTPDQAVAACGEFENAYNNRKGGLCLDYQKMTLVFSAIDKGLSECTFSRGIDLSLDGDKITWSISGIMDICKREPEPIWYRDTIILYSIGISIYGIGEDEFDDAVICAFAEGTWDAFRLKSRPLNPAGMSGENDEV